MRVGLTLCYNHRLHEGDGRAVVIDIHHLDPDGGGAAERRVPPVCCLQNQPVRRSQGIDDNTDSKYLVIDSVLMHCSY